MAPVKLLASPAHSVYTYKNLRTKVMKCCANIYFNRQCLNKKVIPEYATRATIIDNKIVVFWLNLLLEYWVKTHQDGSSKIIS